MLDMAGQTTRPTWLIFLANQYVPLEIFQIINFLSVFNIPWATPGTSALHLIVKGLNLKVDSTQFIKFLN